MQGSFVFSLTEFGQLFLGRVLDVINVVALFRNHISTEEGVILHLKKNKNKTVIHLPKDSLCQVGKICSMVLKKGEKNLNFLNVFLRSGNYLFLEMGVPLYVNRL